MCKLPVNEASIDRLLRVMVGTALVTSWYFNQQVLWLLVGIVPILTGFFGYCPVYHLVGLSTCPMEKKDAKKK